MIQQAVIDIFKYLVASAFIGITQGAAIWDIFELKV